MVKESTALTDKQILKINRILEHANNEYESDNVNACAIYRLFAQRFGVTIIVSWKADNDEFSVINNADNSKLTGSILDSKLNEIIDEITKSQRTLERPKPTHDGKFQTITTTTYRGPNSDLLQKIANEAKLEIPLQAKLDAVRRGMQKVHSLFQNKTEQERIEFLHFLAGMQTTANELVSADYQKRHAKKYAEISQVHSAHQIKANKSKTKTKVEKPVKVKISKDDQKVWNLLKADATQEQFQAKKKQMIALGLLEIAEPIIVDATGEKQKFKIETTSSKEESYNGDKS